MTNAYAAADKHYQQTMAADDRITAIIESAIDDLNAALNAVTDRAKYYCVTEAISKLKELEK